MNDKKLSSVLKQSLIDLLKLEKREDFKINMEVWIYNNLEQKVCEVCLAGALLVQTYKYNYKELFYSLDINQITCSYIFKSIHFIMIGDYRSAIGNFYGFEKLKKYIDVILDLESEMPKGVYYRTRKELYIKNIKKIIKILERWNI